VTLALRSPTIVFPSYRGWAAWGNDEGLYLLMARDLLHGHLPYTQTFDNKPPGIYVIYALAWSILQAGPRSIYVAAGLAIWCGSVAMFVLTKKCSGRTDMGLVAAGAFALYMCGNAAFGANTECFYVPLVAAGFAVLWPGPGERRRDLWAGVGGGALLGLAVCVKYVALYDLVAALVVVAASYPSRTRYRVAAAMLAVAAIPAASVVLVYVRAGELEVLYDSQVRGNLARLALQEPLARNLTLARAQLSRLFPLGELVLAAPFFLRWSKPDDAGLRRTLWLAGVWLLLDIVGISRLGAIRQHLVLQLLPPLILCGTIVLVRGVELIGLRYARFPSRSVVAVALMLLCVFKLAAPVRFTTTTLANLRYASANDRASAVARFLRERVAPDDYVFVVSPWAGMAYVLSSTRSPSRFGGFSYFLSDSRMGAIAGANVAALDGVFAHSPRIVLVDPSVDEDGGFSAFYRRIKADVASDYEERARFDGTYVYARR
jgi:hypothetical protein